MANPYAATPDIALVQLAQVEAEQKFDAASGAPVDTAPEVGGAVHETIEGATSGHTETGHNLPFYETAPFWVAVAFLIVVGAAFKKVSRALTNGLDVRAAKIKSTLDEARQLREDAQALLAEYQRKQRDALKEAEEILTVAKEESKRLKAKAKKEVESLVKDLAARAVNQVVLDEFETYAQSI